jgi:hypothetical protein
MQKYILWILLTILIGCDYIDQCNYIVSLEGIKSNCEMWALSVSQIHVLTMNKDIPGTYNIIAKVETGQKGDHFFSREELEVLTRDKSFNPNKYGYRWKPQTHISFTKKMKYFDWYSFSPNRRHDIFPLKFERDNWYLIRQFQDASQGGGTFEIFIYIDKKANLHQYNHIVPGPF